VDDVQRTAEGRLDQVPLKTMTVGDFERLSRFIYSHCGIKMPPEKKTMLEARLQKRLRALSVQTFRDYCDKLFKTPDGSGELVHMIDSVTTNKTDFFREPVHFDILSDTILSEFIEDRGAFARAPFTIWSAGCSSGEEPYTLAIVLSEFAARSPGFTFTIIATDISTRVLDKARAGIYEESQISMIPQPLKQKYFLRSRDRDKGLVRAAPDLRSTVAFQRLNLMDEQYHLRTGSVDAIFCRNVIIYFDRETQCRLLGRLCSCLRPGGHLFLGHSETVHGFDLPLARLASTVYRKIP
jgi:chemotaxis protein methyltransferase CheR